MLAEGFARVEDLAHELGVSAMTVHRDLDALEAEGWLIKIRGGATANPSAVMISASPTGPATASIEACPDAPIFTSAR